MSGQTRRKVCKSGRLASTVTLSEVLSLQHLPIELAAAEVGVCVTTFKKICRKLGIARWPFRSGTSKTAHANDALPVLGLGAAGGGAAPLTLLAAAGSDAAASLSSEGTDVGKQEQQQQQQQAWAAPLRQADGLPSHLHSATLPQQGLQRATRPALDWLYAVPAGASSANPPMNDSAHTLHFGSQPSTALLTVPHQAAQQQLLLTVLQRMAGLQAPQVNTLAGLALQGNPLAELLQALAAGQQQSVAAQPSLLTAVPAAAAGPGPAGAAHLGSSLGLTARAAEPDPAVQLLQLLQGRLAPPAAQPAADVANLLQQLAAATGAGAHADPSAEPQLPAPQTGAAAAPKASAPQAPPAPAQVAPAVPAGARSDAAAEQRATLALLEVLTRRNAAGQQQQQQQQQQYPLPASVSPLVKPDAAPEEGQRGQEDGQGAEQQQAAHTQQQPGGSDAADAAAASALLGVLLGACAAAGAAAAGPSASHVP
ncbi:hypothetical protein ABPG77_011138 [Micractinium sp. CCAP 211/92]